jgi:hypothetical protein
VKADDLAVVVTAASEFEAETIAEALRAEGLEATVARNAPSGSGRPSVSPSAVGASVLVHREDLERAKTLLAETASNSAGINWDEIDVGQREDDLPLSKVNRVPPLARVSFALALVIVVATALWLLVVILARLF